MRNLFSNLINNTAMVGLIGVIIGCVITGIFTYKTQNDLINSENEKFKSQYMIEKNKDLRANISTFSENLSMYICARKSTEEKREILSNMYASSLKIILLENDKIGQNCMKLTTELMMLQNGEFDEKKMEKIMDEWEESIRLEMKRIDTSVQFDNNMFLLLNK